MAAQYYVREPDSEEAQGPYNMEQLVTLADAGKISRDTLYYDEALESWAGIVGNDDLREQIFPEKRRLNLKAKDEQSLNLLNRGEGAIQSIRVEDMLAAAEGDTVETRFLKELQRDRERAVATSLPLLAGVFLLSALGIIYPAIHIIQDWVAAEAVSVVDLIANPLLILGFVDAFIALCMFLGATEIYMVVRVRALLGVGYFGYLHWAAAVNGDPNGMALALGAVAFGIGTTVMTMTMRFKLVLAAGLLALCGVLATIWFANILPLLSHAGT
jgi:hypothetical protein